MFLQKPKSVRAGRKRQYTMQQVEKFEHLGGGIYE